MAKKSKKDTVQVPGGSSLTNNPFAGLASLRDQLRPGDARAEEQEARPAAVEPSVPARAVLRYERKGRGGKEATIIDKLGLPPDRLARLCQELKRALGCGGSVDGDVIVLSGDLRKRLPSLLEARGIRRISVG